MVRFPLPFGQRQLDMETSGAPDGATSPCGTGREGNTYARCEDGGKNLGEGERGGRRGPQAAGDGRALREERRGRTINEGGLDAGNLSSAVLTMPSGKRWRSCAGGGLRLARRSEREGLFEYSRRIYRAMVRAGHIPKRGRPVGVPLYDGYVDTCFTTYVVLWFSTILLTRANEEGMGTWGRWTDREVHGRGSLFRRERCVSLRGCRCLRTRLRILRRHGGRVPVWESPASSSRPSRSTSPVCFETAASERSSRRHAERERTAPTGEPGMVTPWGTERVPFGMWLI